MSARGTGSAEQRAWRDGERALALVNAKEKEKHSPAAWRVRGVASAAERARGTGARGGHKGREVGARGARWAQGVRVQAQGAEGRSAAGSRAAGSREAGSRGARGGQRVRRAGLRREEKGVREAQEERLGRRRRRRGEGGGRREGRRPVADVARDVARACVLCYAGTCRSLPEHVASS